MQWLTEHVQWITGVVVVYLIARFADRQVGRIVDALDRVDAKIYDLVQGQDRQYNEWTNDIFSIRDGVNVSRSIEEQLERLSDQQAKIIDALEDGRKYMKELPDIEISLRHLVQVAEIASDVQSIKDHIARHDPSPLEEGPLDAWELLGSGAEKAASKKA